MSALEWITPDCADPIEQLRLQAQNEFAGPLVEGVLAVWKDALVNEDVRQEAIDEVHLGLQQAVTALTAPIDEDFLKGTWGYLQGALPPYWEPPVASVVTLFPVHQLRTYRWTAAIIALCVRDALEALHSRFASDDLMLGLNRGLRNTAYDLLLTHPEIAWTFSLVPRAYLEMAARGMQVRIPPVAG